MRRIAPPCATQNQRINFNPLFGSEELKLETTAKALIPFGGKARVLHVQKNILKFSQTFADRLINREQLSQ
jgi:hypothetical protein